jgi:D-amino-acid dehydrogenase
VRVAVIGAGIVGVTTSYELASEGHEVVVFERRGSVAAEASFANAGIVAPGWTMPGAAAPWRLLAPLLGRPAPLRLSLAGLVGQLPWLARWLLASRGPVQRGNRLAVQQLAQASRARILDITHRLDLDYQQSDGVLVLLRGERELKAQRSTLRLLAELGLTFELVDAAKAREIEPSLHAATPLRAAIHLPQDGVGNCRQFAHLLKAEAARLGARYRFEQGVTALRPATRPEVLTAGGQAEAFDAVVLCTGAEGQRLLAPHKLRLPLAPVWGCSVTAPVNHVDGLLPQAPRAALIDERFGIAISRLGQRVRVSGHAELGGRAGPVPLAPLRTLYKVLEEWFPGSAVMREAQHWRGARPTLPDGPPLLGASGLPGVWLNLGHGASGWALSCGSAQVLAALLAGRDPGLDLSRLSLSRLGLR